MLTTSPFGVTVGFQLPDENWTERVRQALPASWQFSLTETPDYYFTLEEYGSDHYLWRLGSQQLSSTSVAESLKLLRQEVQSSLSRFSLKYLFLRGTVLQQGTRTILLTGATEDSGLLALAQDGLLRAFEEPQLPLQIYAMVRVERGVAASLEPTSPAQLAGQLFQESPTPLREIGDWLKVIADMARTLPCYRWTISRNQSLSDLPILAAT